MLDSSQSHLKRAFPCCAASPAPHHALVCSLQLLELPLEHQAAVQDLAVVLVALTGAPTAPSELEGEGIFLLKNLR